jgi:hypothetical protein
MGLWMGGRRARITEALKKTEGTDSVLSVHSVASVILLLGLLTSAA